MTISVQAAQKSHMIVTKSLIIWILYNTDRVNDPGLVVYNGLMCNMYDTGNHIGTSVIMKRVLRWDDQKLD